MNNNSKNLVDMVEDPYKFYSENDFRQNEIPDKIFTKMIMDSYRLLRVDINGNYNFLGGYILGFSLKEKMGTRDYLAKKPKNLTYLCPLKFCQSMEIFPDQLPEIITPEKLKSRTLLERVEINDELKYKIHIGSLAYLSLPFVKDENIEDMELNELIRRFRLSGDEIYKVEFLNRSKNTIDRIVAKIYKPGMKGELENLQNHGKDGALRAFHGFNLDSGFKVSTYLPHRVRGYLLDYLRSLDNVPRSVRKAIKIIKPIVDSLNNNGEKFEPEKYYSELKISLETARLAYEHLTWGSREMSLDIEEKSGTNSGKSITLKEKYIQKVKSTRDEIKRLIDRDFISHILKKLNPIEQELIVGYYLNEEPMKIIGDRMNLSESRISQLHSQIISRLKTEYAEI